MNRTPHIALSAGERSGDLYGGLLIRALRDLVPSVRVSGMGGAAVRAEGGEIIVDSSRHGVVGIADVELARRPDGKVHFMRVSGDFGDDGRFHVRPVAAQGSHQLAATARADAMAVVPDGDSVPAGGEVAVLMLRG